jgi:hypothetical protein
MGGLGQNDFLDFIGINTSYVQGYNNTTNTSASTVTGMITIDNTTYSSLDTSSSFFGTVTGALGFISDFIRVGLYIATLITFTPAVLLSTLHAPIGIIVLVGGVWTMMYILALVGFIRGRDL